MTNRSPRAMRWIPLIGVAFMAAACTSPTPAPGPLLHGVYVWQRAWTPPVAQTVADHVPDFERTIVLAAEVDWKDGVRRAAQADIAWPSLRDADRPVGLAIRVNERPSHIAGPADDPLTDVVLAAVGRARAGGVVVTEIHLDEDAPSARLGQYGARLRRLQRALPDVRLTVTALPDWLRYDAFAELARQVDGVVLQVHATQPPTGADPTTRLCDPAEAKAWIAQAAALDVPFWVALPTYGYRVGVGADGAVIGVAAEARHRGWPGAARVELAMADAPSLAELVRELETERPRTLRGLMWFRMPMPGDALAWRWSTFDKVRRGEPVAPRLRAEWQPANGGAHDLVITNDGDADAPLPTGITLDLPASAATHLDATTPFRVARAAAVTRLNLDLTLPPPTLSPGQARTIGSMGAAAKELPDVTLP